MEYIVKSKINGRQDNSDLILENFLAYNASATIQHEFKLERIKP